MTSAASIFPFLGELSAFSARIGRRIDLVQGPGGNTSIKIANILWIKASGKWLANAELRNLFVPIDLGRARALIDRGIADLSSCVIGESGLRPSIETALHALIDYPVVVHLHSINALSLAIRRDGRNAAAAKLGGLNWGWLDYARPGPDLAMMVRGFLAKNTTAKIILLGNHGLLIAADTVGEAEALVKVVEERLAVPARPCSPPSDEELERFSALSGCRLPSITETHALARDPLSMRLAAEGALYPDHAVFLGGNLPIVGHQNDYSGDGKIGARLAVPPYCVIVAGRVVLLGGECSAASEAMLACCALVTLRQHDPMLVRYLPSEEVEALRTWEMEKFRKQENKSNL